MKKTTLAVMCITVFILGLIFVSCQKKEEPATKAAGYGEKAAGYDEPAAEHEEKTKEMTGGYGEKEAAGGYGGGAVSGYGGAAAGGYGR